LAVVLLLALLVCAVPVALLFCICWLLLLAVVLLAVLQLAVALQLLWWLFIC
jgi:hypothetical protein